MIQPYYTTKGSIPMQMSNEQFLKTKKNAKTARTTAAISIVSGVFLYAFGNVGLSMMTLPINTIQLLLLMKELE